jgi:hypothetical protein
MVDRTMPWQFAHATAQKQLTRVTARGRFARGAARAPSVPWFLGRS